MATVGGWILAGVRTPFAKAGGPLKRSPSYELGRLAIGERQLVEIARMLTRNARVLILDEPTATLSDYEIDRIFAALVALKREGRTILYITHRLAEVFRICDAVTVLRNGERRDVSVTLSERQPTPAKP